MIYNISGGRTLGGDIKIQGSKNALLPLMAASILNKGITVLNNCPDITDVTLMADILRHVGCNVTEHSGTICIDATEINNNDIPDEYVRGMRGSMLFLGALLARCKNVTMDYPGGCLIGPRPVNYHIDALKKMGAEIVYNEEKIDCRVSGRLIGTVIDLPFPSVGATENIIIAGACAEGTTIINNAACEPEIEELCNYLSLLGVRIYGAGGKTIRITGPVKDTDVVYDIMSDRIVTGTYICASAITGGDICCELNNDKVMNELIWIYLNMGLKVECGNDYIKVHAKGRRIKSIPVITTGPYPAFPTDMQSQLMSVMSVAHGKSIIEETVFENRFHIANELIAMGADIKTDNNRAYIIGVRQLYGTDVYAKDLRGGAALIIAGLAAYGQTRVHDPGYISRGYEHISEKINMLGGSIHLE
ncbi:MAG: UDP-N-acetylglucosamine 1-carboxyvinyltransferase [Lachnospiraceae bacterium]|nr:UDP-N-acetylglucosamine 1-carboxyvinyltransferase [Lachnospiraceae bacterium]